MDGAADVAETAYTPFRSKPDAAPVRLIVRRVKPTPGSQLALFASYSYHGFITDRDGDTLELEADHRRHAEVENAIRDLKYGVGLNHLPSGRFAANAAWLAVQSLPRTRYGVLAHNLARWAARIGLGEQLVTTKTLRRRFFSLAGRLTRSARRLTLHLPRGWPWEAQFSRALARLRALPCLTAADPPTGQSNVPPHSRQPSPRVSLPAFCPANPAQRTTVARRRTPERRLNGDRTLPSAPFIRTEPGSSCFRSSHSLLLRHAPIASVDSG